MSSRATLDDEIPHAGSTIPNTITSHSGSGSTSVPSGTVNESRTYLGVPATVYQQNKTRFKLDDFNFILTLGMAFLLLSVGMRSDIMWSIGTGTFGRVYLCQYKDKEEHYAMKLLKKSEIVRLKQVEHINSEKAILSQINHPFIVNLYTIVQVYGILIYCCCCC